MGRGCYRVPRSIPACAGEPMLHIPLVAAHKVYPRVCGGTFCGSWHAARVQGLSPRVRGNPRASEVHPRASRSIPACAGEPWPTPARAACCKVYPRVCGGTVLLLLCVDIVRGLSPRVRGNRRYPVREPVAHRSIPACAGEPSLPADSAIKTTVYPRVCGGTPCPPGRSSSA